MIGLHANVLVRHIVADEPEQTRRVRALMGRLSVAEPAFVSLVTVVELCRVLSRAYRLSADDVRTVLGLLLSADELVVERADLVRTAVAATARTGADVADALVVGLGQAAGCTATVTLDGRAARLDGMELLA